MAKELRLWVSVTTLNVEECIHKRVPTPRNKVSMAGGLNRELVRGVAKAGKKEAGDPLVLRSGATLGKERRTNQRKAPPDLNPKSPRRGTSLCCAVVGGWRRQGCRTRAPPSRVVGRGHCTEHKLRTTDYGQRSLMEVSHLEPISRHKCCMRNHFMSSIGDDIHRITLETQSGV